MAEYDESDIAKEVAAREDMQADPQNVVRGHKANISNPNRSEESKAHSRQVLEEYGETYEPASSGGKGGQSKASQRSAQAQADEDAEAKADITGGKDVGNVIRGLKSSLNNPNVTETGKQNAQDKLNKLEK